jgi:hypothetical protein
MTDEPNGHSADDDNQLPAAWTMPRPVFRSSEGVTPKNRKSDKPAEAAPNAETSVAVSEVVDTPADDSPQAPAQTADRIKVIAAPSKKKTGGCAMSVMAILLSIVAILAVLIAVLAYFYYSTPPPDPFNN